MNYGLDAQRTSVSPSQEQSRIFGRATRAIVAAAIWCSINPVLGAEATGPLSVCPSNRRYFTDGSGKAIYLTGSHTWANFATDQGTGDPPTGIDYDAYLDFLVAHHHNFFRGWVWDLAYSVQGSNGGPFRWNPFPWQRTGPGEATDGQPKFDLSKFDQAYFDRVRSRVRAAGDRGIYVSVMLFQAYALQFNRSDADAYPLDGRNNVNGIDAGTGYDANTLRIPAVTAMQEAYVRKVIDTVNDFDNVLYEIANEGGEYSTQWQYHMVDLVHRYEKSMPKQHPVGMTFQYKGGSNATLFASPADWISPNCSDGYIQDPPPADGSKVMIVDTDHGFGWTDLKKAGPAGQQAWVWKNFLRGNQTLFMDPYLAKIAGPNTGRNSPVGTSPREPYFGIGPDPYWETIRVAMGRARTYAQRLDLAASVPRKDLSSTGYCLANPGQEYLAYNPSPARSFTVTLTEGTYAFEWFNPTTGTVTETGSFTSTAGSRTVTAPFDGDAVLYLRRAR
jgi:hypothetical protein